MSGTRFPARENGNVFPDERHARESACHFGCSRALQDDAGSDDNFSASSIRPPRSILVFESIR
jgi:hypothetical protein